MVFSFILLLFGLLGLSLADSAQFFEQSSNIQFALSAVANGSHTDLYFQFAAPVSAGWAAVGIGGEMAGSLMFVIYPSSNKSATTLSLRSASGHVMPVPLDGISYEVNSTQANGTTMVASAVCHACDTWGNGDGSLDTTSTKASWIWAIGPGIPIASDDVGVTISQHSSQGLFFVNMPAILTKSTAIPQIQGKTDVNVVEQPADFTILVNTHAVLLAGSFLFLFPGGVVALRWLNSFKYHWITQTVAATFCVLGLCVAIGMSASNEEWSSFNQGHQIIGIVAVAIVLFQASLGMLHHRTYQRTGKSSLVTTLHIWTGKGAVLLGQVNAVLGFRLADEILQAAIYGIVAVGINLAMFILVRFGKRKHQARGAPVPLHGGAFDAGSSISLNDYDGRPAQPTPRPQGPFPPREGVDADAAPPPDYYQSTHWEEGGGRGGGMRHGNESTEWNAQQQPTSYDPLRS